MRAIFWLGLFRRLRHYWPIILVIGVVVSLVATVSLSGNILRSSINESIRDSSGAYDLRVSVSSETGDPASLTQKELAEIKKLDQVVAVAPEVSRYLVSLYLADGRNVGLFDLRESGQPEFWDFGQIVAGRLPTEVGQAALSKVFLEESGLKLGDRIRYQYIPSEESGSELEIVGSLDSQVQSVFDFTYLANPSLVVSPAEITALEQRLPEKNYHKNENNQYLINVSDLTKIEAIETTLEGSYFKEAFKKNITVEINPIFKEVSNSVNFSISFVGFFVFLSVLVSIYVIFNIFRISLVRQVRSLALIRINGATRGLVWSFLSFETFCLAWLGLLFGLILTGLFVTSGWLLTTALSDFNLSWGGFSWHFWLIPTLTALVTTALAATVPVIIASRSAPVEALRPPVEKSNKLVLILSITGAGFCLLAVGLMLLLALFLPTGADSVAPGLFFLLGILFLAGMSLLSAGLVKPFGHFLAKFGQQKGFSWRLAADNINRHPGRTATIANSLLIGVSLIVLVTIIASSFKASAFKVIRHYIPAEIIVGEKLPENFDQFFDGVLVESAGGQKDFEISADLVENVLESEKIKDPTVFYYNSSAASYREKAVSVERVEEGDEIPLTVVGLSSGNIGQNFNFELLPSEISDEEFEASLATGGQVFLREIGLFNDATKGSLIDVWFESDNNQPDRQRQYQVAGHYQGGDFDIIMSASDFKSAFNSQAANSIWGQVPEGTDRDTAIADLNSLLASHKEIEAYSFGGLFIDFFNRIIDTVLAIFRALLSLSLIVAVLGIFSNLILALSERLKEIGLLRSLGLSRLSASLMFAWEGMIMALFGSLLGVITGLTFATPIVLWVSRLEKEAAMASEAQTFISVSWPIKQIIFYLFLSTVFGFLAAVIPAWLAGRKSITSCLRDN